ncbi:pyridoxamine 5'-phosphate oxidase family protein [Aerosakkonemataceae cyanobacterium BLCC-F50]|uniref:Pyridoxamine 5'-phosphate oxidase family protein n=1 Tax=Floridaenema flaviceps BLCC-F50 TaxID=3153642 RepID=A0ABV4Y4Y7_9CYAN
MMPFHSGEIAVQTRAGVREDAERIGQVICNTVKPAALSFLGTQQMAIASTIASNGTIWASLLTGSPGFIQVLNDQIIQIQHTSNYIDILHQNLEKNSAIGLLVIDLSNRKRLRLNGNIKMYQSEMFQVKIQQAFFNCPKYIQTRYLETSAIAELPPPEIHQRNTLNSADESWINQADTFFIATANSTQGADASHRGGYPGFVQVINFQTLLFPDYAGNNMFQTLGNLAQNSQAGLLFIDFEQGHTLQLTGEAVILWNTELLSTFPGAQRLIKFAINRVVETRNATTLRWQFGEYSPANPALPESRSKKDL